MTPSPLPLTSGAMAVSHKPLDHVTMRARLARIVAFEPGRPGGFAGDDLSHGREVVGRRY